MAEDGSLTEIGPRFVLNPIKIFDSSFSGKIDFELVGASAVQASYFLD